MSVPPRFDHQLGDLETLTAVQLPSDVIAKIIPFLPDDLNKVAIASLPDDILDKIISFLPEFPQKLTYLNLKNVYQLLSLARLHPMCASMFTQHSSVVKYIDPFPGIPHSYPLANMPPYAQPEFLSLLVSICPGLYSLRAPSVKRVIGFASDQLEELAFIDDGLTLDDLCFLSRSFLTTVTVMNPSEAVLAALAQIRTLERVTLLRISPDVISAAVSFFDVTTASYLSLDLDSSHDQDLYYLIHRLPLLRTFILKCQVRHAWSMLKYLRSATVQIGNVYMIVDGVHIALQNNDAAHNYENGSWEASVMHRLICRTDIRAKPRNQHWPEGMSLRELDLDLLEGVHKYELCRGLIDKHFLNCSETAPIDNELVIRLGRDIPSSKVVWERGNWIKATRFKELATSLVISQDLIRYAGSDCRHWPHNFLQTALSNFTMISTLHICKSSRSVVSGRFVLALPDFLKTVTKKFAHLKTVFLENAGELVLQTVGMLALTDEQKMKKLLQAVISCVKELESMSDIEMGTVITQLEIWASNKLRAHANVIIDEAVP